MSLLVETFKHFVKFGFGEGFSSLVCSYIVCNKWVKSECDK